MRWSTALPSREVFSLRDYFSALFSAPEGHYRVIVFVVSDKPFATSRGAASREQAAAWLQGGLNLLPAAIANLPVSANHACTALIYQFHKQGFQGEARSEEHTSELQSLMRISYAVFCLKKKKTNQQRT